MSLPNEQRVAIREKLVTCLTSESVTDVRKKVGDAVAEIARQYTDNGMRLDTHKSGIDGSDGLGFYRRSMDRAAGCPLPGQPVPRGWSARDCFPDFHYHPRRY